MTRYNHETPEKLRNYGLTHGTAVSIEPCAGSEVLRQYYSRVLYQDLPLGRLPAKDVSVAIINEPGHYYGIGFIGLSGKEYSILDIIGPDQETVDHVAGLVLSNTDASEKEVPEADLINQYETVSEHTKEAIKQYKKRQASRMN